jgi:hypothetical protein
MKIYKNKEGDKLICEIPFYQHKNNPYDEEEEKELTNNLIGVMIEKGKYYHEGQGIYQLNDLSYKDDQQVGGLIISTYLENKEFVELCEKLEIPYIEHAVCAYCDKVIYGSFTVGDKGNQCFDCELKDEK